MLTREERIALGLAICGMWAAFAGVAHDFHQSGITVGFGCISVIGGMVAILSYLSAED